MKLHLGVIDLPYVDDSGTAKKRKAKVVIETTGDVAEILEKKYGVMQHFFDAHGDEIASALEESLAGSLETLLMGGPSSIDLYASAAAKIEERFHRFLESKEMDAMGVPGVPTLASLLGISHRFKRKRGPPRPSFIDTGAYSANFKIWLDE
ncbi:MAG TPA: hypothetical protein VMV19_17550 [Xanthobacteraceae bacterium]|nr:hypothetical protein [Xanthobacteraceae bacterium]